MTHPLVSRIIEQPLLASEAEPLMQAMLTGELNDHATAGVLGALAARKVTAEELAGFAAALRSRMIPVPCPEGAIDTCGTGGSGQATLNTSTLAGVVAAASGAVVAKHGNRSASGRCGSLDVLEALGAPVELSPEANSTILKELGFAFLNARQHHPGLARLGPIRKGLGFRTVFNLLGPILNPARVRRQLLGLSRADLAPTLAEGLVRMGHERSWVVAGPDGLDEIGLTGITQVWAVEKGEIQSFSLDPGAELGLRPGRAEDLAGGDAERNAARFREILEGKDEGPARDHVALNAGAALVVSGRAYNLAEGLDIAKHSLSSGAAAERFEAWVTLTRRWAAEASP